MSLYRIRMRSTVEQFDLENGTIVLVPATGDSDFLIRPPNEVERYLLSRLQAPVDPTELQNELVARFGVERKVVQSYVETLWQKCLLAIESCERKLEEQDLVRFDRQLAYFESIDQLGIDAAVMQWQLKRSKVFILGCGGLGSLAAVELCAAGVGSFVLADDDLVELHNLNRQIVFGEDSIGKKKVDVLDDELCRRNSMVSVRKFDKRIESSECLDHLIGDVDFLLLAGDEPPDRLPRIVDSVCAQRGIPFLSISSVPPIVRVGPLFLGERGVRWESFEEKLRSAYPRYDTHMAYSALVGSRAAATSWSMSIAVGFAVREVVGYLTNVGVSTEEGYFLVDTDAFGIERKTLGSSEL